MCLMALCGLMHHAAMGGKADFAVFNLGRTWEGWSRLLGRQVGWLQFFFEMNLIQFASLGCILCLRQLRKGCEQATWEAS